MWFDRIAAELNDIAFNSLQHAPCVYKRDHVLLLVYVDDFLIIAESHDKVSAVKKELDINLPTKDLGEAGHFLGANVLVRTGCVSLRQSKVITVLLKKRKFADTRSIAVL